MAAPGHSRPSHLAPKFTDNCNTLKADIVSGGLWRKASSFSLAFAEQVDTDGAGPFRLNAHGRTGNTTRAYAAKRHSRTSSKIRRKAGSGARHMVRYVSRKGSHKTSRYRCVFSIFMVAGIIPIFPRVSSPTNASTPTGDAKRLDIGREWPEELRRLQQLKTEGLAQEIFSRCCRHRRQCRG
jgi:hypothetical protein